MSWSFSKDSASARVCALRSLRNASRPTAFSLGSEKHLSWGTRSRYEILAKALEELTGGVDASMSEEDFETRILVPARGVLRACFWIDNQDMGCETNAGS